MSEALRDLISSAMTDLDPGSQDNHEPQDAEANVEHDEYETDEVSDDVDAAVGAEDEDEDADLEVEETDDSEESEDEASDNGETYTVKVNGEALEVTLEELKSGYQRQADYTREKQALKKDIEEFEEVRETLVGAYEGLQSLEEAWEEDPITVLAQFTNNTENPTHAVALLIKELAPVLDRDFLETFGITPEIQRQWMQESQANTAQRQQSAQGSRREQELAAAQEELEIQRAIAEYDRQLDEILEENDLDFTVKQRNAFRQELAAYAAENELTNLKAAYKAFKYEETQKNKAKAASTAKKAKEKKAASVVTRSGSGSDGAKPVQDNSDLHSVVLAAMKDAQANLG